MGYLTEKFNKNLKFQTTVANRKRFKISKRKV